MPGASILGVEALGIDSAPRVQRRKAPAMARRFASIWNLEASGFARASHEYGECLWSRPPCGPRGGHAARGGHVPIDPGSCASSGRGSVSPDGGTSRFREPVSFYLLTEFVEASPTLKSLRRVADSSSLDASDLLRVDRLAAYLAELHAEKPELPFARQRALRDLFGSGEGIFGIVDGYPDAAPGVAPAHLRRLEALCGDWRWRLKRIARPLARTHGDFHPFNVLFDHRDQPVLLDASRGCAGEPADDVTCMAINYPFFALERADTWPRFSVLWYRFWSRYLELSQDDGVLRVAAPFLAWRALVLASPTWYPKLSADARTRLLAFAETALSAEAFAPESVERMFR